MSFQIQVHNAVADIGREAWDACASPTGDPFVSFDFLDACEASGSAVADQGWAGRHLSLRDPDGHVQGVMPLWLKGHSQGEYVFDHSWAEAYQRAGGRYYPKLLSAVPFTPVTGPRFLTRPDTDAASVRQALLQGAIALTERLGVSSLHVNFPTRADWDTMGEAGLLQRQDMQYVWRNEGYATFDDFLAACRRAAARPSGASGARPGRGWISGSSPVRRSPRRTGMPSSPSIWTPVPANGAVPT